MSCLECSFCFKSYKRKDFYAKHVTLCRLLRESSKDEMREELQDLPNMYEMYMMVKELGQKYVSCQEECKGLRDKVRALENEVKNIQIDHNDTGNDKIEKRFTNPYDYVCEQGDPDVSVEEWIKNLRVDDDDLQYLMDKPTAVIEFICKTVKGNCSEGSPLRAFKWNNTFYKVYVYTSKVWQPYTFEQFGYMIQQIIQYVLCVQVPEVENDPEKSCQMIHCVSSIQPSKKMFQDFHKRIVTVMEED